MDPTPPHNRLSSRAVTSDLSESQPIETLYAGLNFPIFTFAPDGRVFFNEKNTANIRVIAGNDTELRTLCKRRAASTMNSSVFRVLIGALCVHFNLRIAEKLRATVQEGNRVNDSR